MRPLKKIFKSICKSIFKSIDSNLFTKKMYCSCVVRTKIFHESIVSYSDDWSYEIEVRRKGIEKNLYISKEEYDKIKEGEEVKILCTIGKFSSKLYMKDKILLNNSKTA